MTQPEYESGEIDEKLVETIRPVLERYREHWPLCARQVFYRVVKEGGAGQWLDEFGRFAGTLRGALVKGLIPLGSVAEEENDVRQGGAWENAEEFVHEEIESFLWGYRRDVMQGQERYVEAWVQKPGVMDLISESAVGYCVTTVACRRMPMARFMEDFRRRLEEVRGRSQQPVILYFGDYVPGGNAFLGRVQDALRTEGNLWEIEFRQEALTEEDVKTLDLPESIETRSRRSHNEEPGRAPVELEAMDPETLAARVRSAIEAQLDMELVNNQRAIQSREALRLGKLRTSLMRQVRPVLREFMPEEEA